VHLIRRHFFFFFFFFFLGLPISLSFIFLFICSFFLARCRVVLVVVAVVVGEVIMNTYIHVPDEKMEEICPLYINNVFVFKKNKK